MGDERDYWAALMPENVAAFEAKARLSNPVHPGTIHNALNTVWLDAATYDTLSDA